MPDPELPPIHGGHRCYPRFPWAVLLGARLLWCRRCGRTELHEALTGQRPAIELTKWAVKHSQCPVPAAWPAQPELPPLPANPDPPPPTPTPIPTPTSSNRAPDVEEARPTPAEVPVTHLTDRDVDIIRAAYFSSVDLAERVANEANRIDMIVEDMAAAPGLIRDEALMAALPEIVSARDIVDEMVGTFEEFENIVGYRILIEWYTTGKKKNDDPVLGFAKTLSDGERQLWPGGGHTPWFRVRLSLPYWLAAHTDHARKRLAHHELMHLRLIVIEQQGEDLEKPRLRNHHVEEFVTTVRRFGLAGPLQEEFVREGARYLGLVDQPTSPDRGPMFDPRAASTGDRS